MKLDELKTIIKAAGGSDNAIAYAEALLEKVSRVEAEKQYAPLIAQLRASREQGDFRGRVLEVNFADCFIRKGIALAYGVKQGMPGDIDFGWGVEGHDVCLEMKLLREHKVIRDEINAQLDDKGVSAKFVNDDTRDVARLQTDLIQKATTRKFNPTPSKNTVNLVAVDVSELQLGTADLGDCLLAAGGNTLAARHFGEAFLRESVVGAFENCAPEKLRESQKAWVASVQKLPDGAPHPRGYIHGALFLFREPKETAALSYELRAAIAWNPNLADEDMAKKVCGALHAVIPQER